MRFFTSVIFAAAATTIGAATAQLCPSANGLFYQADSGALYQVQCATEYWTRTNLISSFISDPLACADACEAWSSNNPTKQCAAGSWENTTGTCYLKPGDLTAQKRPNLNVISLILTPPA